MSAVKKKVGYGKFRRNIQSELESDTRDDIYYEAAPTRKFSETSPHVTDISSITKSSLLDEEDSNLYDNPLHSTVLGDEHSAQKKHEALSHNKPKKNKAVSKKNKGVISKTVGPVAKTQKPTSRPLKRLSEMLEREDSSDLESEASINEADPSDNTPLSQAQTDTTEKSESVQSRAKAGKKSAAVSKPRTGRKQAQRLSPSVEESSDEEASDVESSNPKNGLKPVRKKKNKPSSASSDEAGPSKKVKKLPKNITELDVVLDVFQGFVSEYKETVEPSVCRNAIERLYNKVSDHLLETITQVKECTELKKKSTKIVNAINKKRRHLIEVKSNLIKREIHLRKVQKEYAELKDRYTDLKSGSTFLDDFKDLQMRYLEHRNNNTGEKEKYGLSSLPSLLLEARGILGAEEQLQNINFKLQQAIGN
ncbi:centromere protein U isoform X4 [Polyodon spathula]|uniref:centromere protein U isoform X4 n=1 Tax=Polyodon spathula TaxID=7913 RepID=UPI001B7E0B41|nr:centromere protein U isoform X4 [Polyodon spathula]